MSGIVVDMSCQCQAVEFDQARLAELATSVVERFSDDDNVSVSVAIVSDTEIVEVHKEYLHKDTVTDVISFDLSDDDECVFEIIVN
ncbi:MAG: rRNA maturation RNAse YbeY, partial [Anaerohalosphaera sp.]|nr:rRNA maturation RNAse YbeY [Anaerohalosphaera sp.]